MKRSRLTAAVAVLLCITLAGCPPIAAWITLATTALATIFPLIGPILTAVSSLTGKTIPPDVSATINTAFSQAQQDLQLANQLITQYQSSQDPSVLGRISALLDGVKTNMGALLVGLHISNPASQQKIVDFANFLIAEAKDIAALVPVFSHGRLAARRVESRQAQEARAQRLSQQSIKARFHAVASKPTGDAQVDQAFALAAAIR